MTTSVLPLGDYRLPPDVRMQRVVAPLSETIDWGHPFLGMTPELYAVDCSNIKIAVLDTGVEPHPDLVITDRFDCTGSPSGPGDVLQHGTWCFGYIGAVPNTIGVRGIAAGAKMYSIKVLGDNGSGTDRTIEMGVRKADDLGVDIISMSLGGRGMSQSVRQAMRDFIKRGGYIFAAAGNDGRDPRTGQPYPENDPAAFPEVFGIAATDHNGKLTDFSCYDAGTTCAGPGFQMLSTVPGGYAVMSGTSMACPAVAACWAKILARQRANNRPHKTYQEVEALIREKATLKNGLRIINPLAMLEEIQVTPPPTDPGSIFNRIVFNEPLADGRTVLIGLVA